MATPTGFLRICVLSANDDVKSWARSKATDERVSVYGTISTFNEQLQHFGGYDSSEYKNRKYQAGQMYNVMYGLNAEGNSHQKITHSVIRGGIQKNIRAR